MTKIVVSEEDWLIIPDSTTQTRRNKNLKPMFKYCSFIMHDLNNETTYELAKDLLKIVQTFAPILKVTKKTSHIALELNGKH